MEKNPQRSETRKDEPEIRDLEAKETTESEQDQVKGGRKKLSVDSADATFDVQSGDALAE
ncbi:MAG TPA: hypothetical protein VMM18_10715 [Gemmatimonadaceae bacterium]|nr:hypothetical protein [Gemmatimonadaceae bacterium]